MSGYPVTALRVIEHLGVVEDIGSGVIAAREDLATNALAHEQLKKTLSHVVIVTVASTTHAGHAVVITQEVLPVVAGELGGFNRSLQHFQSRRRYGKTRGVDAEVNGTRCDALARCSFASA